MPNEISYIVEGTGPDGKAQVGVDDLRQTIRRTLSDYLQNLTAAPPDRNAYPVPPGYLEASYRDEQGEPADIVTGGASPDAAFSTDPSLDTYSNPFLDALAETIRVTDYLDKGVDGHTTLQEVEGSPVDRSGDVISESEGETLVERQISQVLRSNRFNPSPGQTPFITGDDVPEPTKLVASEGSLGAYADPTTGQILGTEVTFDDMRKVALSLMLRATGHDQNGTIDPDDATPLAPSAVQIGTGRVDPVELEARRAFGVSDLSRVSLESDFPRPASDDFRSFGQMNSYLEPFDGFLPLGMITLAAASAVTLVASTQVIFDILSTIVASDNRTLRIDPGPYAPGFHGRPPTDSILSTLIAPEKLGILRTKHNYSAAVFRGVQVLFGFSGDDVGSVAASSMLNLSSSPGFYATMTRAVGRSLEGFTNALRDVDFTNPLEGAQAVLGLVDVIKRSKVVGFLNVVAGLGDITLTLDRRGYIIVPGRGRVYVSDVDRIPENPATHVMKSRSKDGSSAASLAWRSDSTRSAFVLPASLITAAGDFDANNKYVEGLLGSGLSKSMHRVDSGGRISTDVVREVENELECEYVPFYFHDLRTNEIVSFHAFLSALNDSYNVNHESIDAYGRIDPVRIYRNTERAINLSFYVAATSREDFDVVWWKINKLMTLLYPQWSSGRIVEGPDGLRFEQPFSQIPTASPLIRLRIGDVIKSNYSKFNLARLFGLGGASFSPSDSFRTSKLGDQINEGTLSVFVETVNRMTKDPDLNPGNGYRVGDLAILEPTRVGYYTEGSVISDVAGEVASFVTTRPVGNVKRQLFTSQEYKVTVLGVRSTPSVGLGTNYVDGARTNYIVSFRDTPPPGFEGVNVIVTHADLRVDPKHVARQVSLRRKSDEGDVTRNTVDEVSRFFSPTSNVVVRSFESTKGRGLAGVIKSVNFDWKTPPWETEVTARAPMWCLVDMSFAPIHDIPPGLDKDGSNRAPIYPVGIVGDLVGDIHDTDVRDTVMACIREYESVVSERLF